MPLRLFPYCRKKVILLFLAGMLGFTNAQSQTMKAIEYFFDTDPGVGNGIRINLNATKQVDTVLNFNMAALSFGLHQLYVRAQDVDNEWSLYHIFPVIKGIGGNPSLVQKIEYFFDTDPGVGNGIAINLPNTAIADANITLDLSSLSVGIHHAYFRVMDNAGKWSLYHTYPVIKGPGTYAPLTVQKLEFFLDDDPGVGNAIPVPANPKFIIDSTFILPLPNTTKDTVNLFIRAQDNRGLWGLYHDTLIIVSCDIYKFKPDFSFSDTLCVNSPVYFRDSSLAASRKWHFGDGDSSSQQNPLHFYRAPGNYTVSLYVISAKGCISDTMEKVIRIEPGISVDAGPEREVYAGERITLDPIITGNDSAYLWTPDLYLNNNKLRNPQVTGVTDILYTLYVTGKGGCTASDSVLVKVITTPRDVKIPNAFSPNGDGINDYWVIPFLSTYAQCRVQVFNRYGQEIFISQGYPSSWDGRYKGKALPFGTYYYIIQLNDESKKVYTGSVTIIY